MIAAINGLWGKGGNEYRTNISLYLYSLRRLIYESRENRTSSSERKRHRCGSKVFSDLLGIEFDLRYDIINGRKSIKLGNREVPREKITTEHADVDFEQSTQRVAVSPVLELIQAVPPLEKEGLPWRKRVY